MFYSCFEEPESDADINVETETTTVVASTDVDRVDEVVAVKEVIAVKDAEVKQNDRGVFVPWPKKVFIYLNFLFF